MNSTNTNTVPGSCDKKEIFLEFGTYHSAEGSKYSGEKEGSNTGGN